MGDKSELQHIPRAVDALVLSEARSSLIARARKDAAEIVRDGRYFATFISSHSLNALIARTVFAIAGHECKEPWYHYRLDCALLIISSGSLTMVATDGRRLSIVKKPNELNQEIEGERRVLIPRDIVHRLQTLLPDTNADKVGFANEGNTFTFRLGQETLSWTKAEGAFPDYETTMPKGFGSFSLVNAGKLSAAIRRVIQIEPRTWGWEARQNIIRLSLGEKELKIGPMPTEFFEEFAESIDTSYSGDPRMVGLNADLILDFFGALGDTDEVRIGYVEINTVEKARPSPAICIENIGLDCRILYIVMSYKLD